MDLEGIAEELRSLRVDGTTAARWAGNLLAEAKGLLPRGHWLPWLGRVGLTRQSAADYLTVFRRWDEVKGAERRTIKEFLHQLRRGGSLPVRIEHADARLYDWPKGIDVAVIDPPASDKELFRWAAGWASSHLRGGGFALVFCGAGDLGRVMAIFGAKLTYRWTLGMPLSFMFPDLHDPSSMFRPAWRPALLYARGLAEPLEPLTDWAGENCHVTQSWHLPVEPIRVWLSALIRAPALVADPFAGTGTVGVASRALGLDYIGTERNPDHFATACGRLKVGP